MNTEVLASVDDTHSEEVSRHSQQQATFAPLAEHTLGLPPRPGSSKNPPSVAVSSSRSRPQMIASTPVSTSLFDQNRQKREEISQFLEQNGAGNLSTISTGHGVVGNNASMLQLQNLNKSSDVFNRTDMRIYQHLFPEREIQAQRFMDLSTTVAMARSPSFIQKGVASRDANNSFTSHHQMQGHVPRSSSQKRSSNSQIRLNKPRS